MNVNLNLTPGGFPIGPSLFSHENFLKNRHVTFDSLDLYKSKTRFNEEVLNSIATTVKNSLKSLSDTVFVLVANFDGGRQGTILLSSYTGSPDVIITVTNQGVCVSSTAIRSALADVLYSVIRSEFYVRRDFISEEGDETKGNPVHIEYHYLEKGELGVETYRRFPSSDLIDELYENIDPKRMMDQLYSSKDTILFMHGDPGVGKSQIVQYGIEYLSRTSTIFNKEAYHWKENTTPCIWYVKDLKVLNMDQFWSQLVAREPEMVVFDDISSGIAPRGRNEVSSFVEKFLSISDGIFRIRTKFIFTTNLGKEDIDSALLRPGRCFDYFHMKPLTVGYAKALMNRQLEQRGLDHTDALDGMTEVPQALFCQILDRLVRKPGTYYRNSL